DSVTLEDRGINISTYQMCICVKHNAGDAAPHHQLDHAVRDTFFDHVRNPRMTKNVGGDMLIDLRPFSDTFQLLLDRGVREWCLPFSDENQVFAFRFKRIVRPPFGEMFPGHDKPQVPWLLGLEPDIDDDPIFIKFQIAPFQIAQLADTETSLVEHYNDGPVDTPGTYLNHGRDLFRGEKVGSGLGHGIFLRALEFPDLALRQRAVLVFNQP